MYYIGARSSDVYPSDDLGKLYFSSSSNKKFKNEQMERPDNYIYKIFGHFSS
jgi:hypothetical protein